MQIYCWITEDSKESWLKRFMRSRLQYNDKDKIWQRVMAELKAKAWCEIARTHVFVLEIDINDIALEVIACFNTWEFNRTTTAKV